MPDYEKVFQECKQETIEKWDAIALELDNVRDKMNERCSFCQFTAMFQPLNLDNDPYPTKWQRVEHYRGLCFRCPAVSLCFEPRRGILDHVDDAVLKLRIARLALSKLELAPPWVKRKEGEPAQDEEQFPPIHT